MVKSPFSSCLKIERAKRRLDPTYLIAKNFLKELKGLEARAAVYNLFNKDYTAPTAANELPGDMPMPGINFMLELRYTF